MSNLVSATGCPLSGTLLLTRRPSDLHPLLDPDTKQRQQNKTGMHGGIWTYLVDCSFAQIVHVLWGEPTRKLHQAQVLLLNLVVKPVLASIH